MIYVETPPTICKKHIETRTQPGDREISLEYLTMLDKNYLNMYKEYDGTKYKIDGSQTIEQVHNEIMEIIENKRTLNSQISFSSI